MKYMERNLILYPAFRFFINMLIIGPILLSLSRGIIVWLLVFAALFSSLMRLGYWLYQPYFDWVDVDIIYYGYIFATMKFYVNLQVSDDYRATTISMVSLIASLSFAIISPLVGFGLDQSGTQTVYRFIGIMSIGGLLALFFLRKHQKGKRKTISR